MKKLLFLAVYMLPIIAIAQGYKAVNLNINYCIGYKHNNWLSEANAINTGVAIEKYFKFGLKLSAGVNIDYSYYPKQKVTTINTQPTDPVKYYRGSRNSIEVPITMGFNVLSNRSKFQLFTFIGYSPSLTVLYKTSYYDSSKSNKISEAVYKQSNWGNYLLYGLELRYVTKNKYFFGLNTTLSRWFNKQLFAKLYSHSVGIKVGVLF
jgi:hypothetical protein